MDSLKNTKTMLASANKEIIGFINAFVDKQSLVETDAFVCSQTDFGSAPGEGVVSGVATVDGRYVCVFATNPAVLKGSVGALNAKKITRTINNAVRMGRPLIAVWDSCGARIAEGIECLEGYNDILRAYTLAYGDVPVISIIKGNNFGLSSYVSGLSDFVIACPEAVSATASPLVLAAKTGTDEKKFGTAASLAEKGIVTNIAKKTELRSLVSKALTFFNGVTEDTDDLNRVCRGLKAGATANDVIKQIVDKNSFLPVRAEFAKETVTGFATLAATTVGIVGVDGRLTADGCVKISEFLNTCVNMECPVIVLTNSEGTEQTADDARLIREMSNLIFQINSVEVDMISLVYGKAVGAAYTTLVAPCEYKIAWEDAYVGALESEAAARLMYADEIKGEKNKDKAVEKLAKAYSEENGCALRVATTGHFDNVIAPNHSRVYLISALLAHIEG